MSQATQRWPTDPSENQLVSDYPGQLSIDTLDEAIASDLAPLSGPLSGPEHAVRCLRPSAALLSSVLVPPPQSSPPPT